MGLKVHLLILIPVLSKGTEIIPQLARAVFTSLGIFENKSKSDMLMFDTF
jgi:hypothetical protein